MVGALLLYMAFLMLVDPLIRKPDAYTERLHNEEESEVRALPAPLVPEWGPWSPPPGPHSLFSIQRSPFCSVFLREGCPLPSQQQQGRPEPR